MDYRVTLILEYFDKSLLTAPIPIDTAWGSAIRAGEEGTYAWKSVIVKSDAPAKHIIDLIPSVWQGVTWQFISVLNFQWETDRVTEQVQEQLLEFIAMAIAKSGRWCIAIEKDCDQMDGSLQLSADELLGVVRGLLRNEGVGVEGAFCIAL